MISGFLTAGGRSGVAADTFRLAAVSSWKLGLSIPIPAAGQLLNKSYIIATVPTIEEELVRREGKRRRCCLGDGIHSIPCRTTDLAPG